MQRLLAANKVRLARNKVIQIFQHELGYALRADQFLDFDLSRHFVGKIYRQMRTVPERKLATVHEVRGELVHLKEMGRVYDDQHVILFHRLRSTGRSRLR